MRLALAFAFTLALSATAAVTPDIEYARPNGTPLLLDASIPEGSGPFPAVIIVHGGSWIHGTKQTYVTPILEPLTNAGFAWFSINYRLAPEGRFPLAVDDVDSAVRWLKKHAKEYRVDPQRIALLGESAGAHLVTFSAVRRASGAGVKAVVSFYTPSDLETRVRDSGTVSEGVQKFIGVTEANEDTYRKLHDASPYYLVSAGLPPFLLLHGTKDALVPYEQSVRLCEKLKSAGDKCELYTIPDGAHGMGSWDKLPGAPQYKAKVVDWLKANL
jgi:acetyl esterase